MVNCLLVPTGVFQEVGIVVVDFGIVRQRLDTRTTIRKESMGGKKALFEESSMQTEQICKFGLMSVTVPVCGN